MIISYQYAKQLEREGKATFEGLKRPEKVMGFDTSPETYHIIKRHDKQRIDYVRLDEGN